MSEKTFLPLHKSSIYNPNGTAKKIDPRVQAFLCLKCKQHKYMPELHGGSVCKDCHKKRCEPVEESRRDGDPGDEMEDPV